MHQKKLFPGIPVTAALAPMTFSSPLLSAAAIIRGWRVAVLVIVLFCALATPAAAVVSMFLLAVPMVILYFASYGVSCLHDRRAKKRPAAFDADVEAWLGGAA